MANQPRTVPPKLWRHGAFLRERAPLQARAALTWSVGARLVWSKNTPLLCRHPPAGSPGRSRMDRAPTACMPMLAPLLAPLLAPPAGT